MAKEKFERDDIVSFWSYMGNRQSATGPVANCALVFAKVIRQGEVWVTLETEHGRRCRRQPWELSLAPEGAEYFQKGGTA